MGVRESLEDNDFECLSVLHGHQQVGRQAKRQQAQEGWGRALRSAADSARDLIGVFVDGMGVVVMQDVKFVKFHPSEELLFSASYDDTIKVGCWAHRPLLARCTGTT